MRVLVCGGREFDDWNLLKHILNDYIPRLPNDYVTLAVLDNTIIQGGAKGADFLARVYAKAVGYKWEEYPADWKKYGPAAGPIRNQQMLDEGKPDMVIAFPGGRGTANMIKLAKKAGVEVVEVEAS